MPFFRDPALRSAVLLGARILVVVTVLGGLAALALVRMRPDSGAEPQRALPRVAAPVLLPAVEPPLPPAPRVPSAVPAVVWTRDLGAPARSLQRDAAQVPAGDLCSALAEAGWAMSGWSESALDASFHECIGERNFADAAADEITNGFVILRGGTDGSARELRVKLNMLDEATAPEAADALVASLEAVFGKLRWELPAEVGAAVRERRAVSLDRAGAALRFSREVGDVARYNLRLLIPPPPGPSDRFVPPRAGRSGLAALEEALPGASASPPASR